MITCLSLRQRLLSSSVVPSSIRADEIVDDLIGKSKRKQPLRGKNRINQMPSEWEQNRGPARIGYRYRRVVRPAAIVISLYRWCIFFLSFLHSFLFIEERLLPVARARSRPMSVAA